MDDDTLVCPWCGSDNIRRHSLPGDWWIQCDECGEEDKPIKYGDWLSSQEGPHMIPDGYNEQ